jgi:MFS family permease
MRARILGSGESVGHTLAATLEAGGGARSYILVVAAESPSLDASPRTSPFFSVGRALRHRNYRLYFTGQSISLIGTWLTKVATAWLVYRLTGSAWLLGVVGFAGQIPAFVMSPVAGVLVDRWDRHRVLLATQALAMLQSAVLAALALGGVIQVWEVIALNVLQGCIDAFDMPVRQSLLVRMVDDRADLPNAIALNSSMVNGARLFGPAIAGVLIAAVGEGWCFFVDAVSYGAVLISVLLLRVDTTPPPPKDTHVLREMADGFRYASGSAPIRALLLLLAVSGLAGRPFAVLLPVIASQAMHGGAGTLGALQAAAGLGALAGGLYLASRVSILGLGRVVAISAALFGLGLVAFSRAHALWLAMPMLLVAGTGMMVQTAASNTIIQTIVDEDKRGRVMSLLVMSLFGTVPIGSLIAGALATRIGAENTILLGGTICALAALLFLRALPGVRRAVRPIYERMGILPAARGGAETASTSELRTQ